MVGADTITYLCSLGQGGGSVIMYHSGPFAECTGYSAESGVLYCSTLTQPKRV